MPRHTKSTKWITFTRRTEDPKLVWLEAQLLKAGIPSRRAGYTYHAPILEVPEEFEDAAEQILAPVDDIDDDDPRWTDPKEFPHGLMERLQTGAERAEAEHFAKLSTNLSRVKGMKQLVKKLRKYTRPRR